MPSLPASNNRCEMQGNPGGHQQAAFDQTREPVKVQPAHDVGRGRPSAAVAEPGIVGETLGVAARSGQRQMTQAVA